MIGLDTRTTAHPRVRLGSRPHNLAMMIQSGLEELPLASMLPASPVFRPDEIEAYCVKCKTCHPMVSPQLVSTKTGKAAARGHCPVCRTTMMKRLPNRYV
jgi:hypothetical protein